MNAEDQELLTSTDPASKQHASYAGVRQEILALSGTARNILDVGCNEGSLGNALKSKHPDAVVWGCDINPDAISIARSVLDKSAAIDLDEIKSLASFLGEECFDLIIAADVLEHTKDPWTIAKLLRQHLTDDGRLVISLPNLGRWDTLLHLFGWQTFPRKDRGIFDATHLRFFLRKNLNEFSAEGFTLNICNRNMRFFEHKYTPWIDRYFCRLVELIPGLREYFVFQWVFCVTRDSQ